MKMWAILGGVLILCVLFAVVRRLPRGQEAISPGEETQQDESAQAGNPGKSDPVENPGSPVSPAPAEAVLKVFNDFQDCLKNERYEQAWELTTQYFKDKAVRGGGGVEKFKEIVVSQGLAAVTAHPEPVSYMDHKGQTGQLALRVTSPSFGDRKMYYLFIEEDGKWKFNTGYSP